MAAIVNERDVLIRSAPSRLVDHDLASNVNVPVFKGISLAAPGAIFRLAVNGDVSPTSITATVSHRGFAEAPAITWSVVYGDLTVEPSGTGLTYEMVAANMVTDVVTVQASVTVAGMTYTDAIMFVKIQDGSVGLPGSRGTINAVRAITGTAWSTPEAVQALADYGLEDPFDPIAGDVVTLHNLNEGFSEIRRFSGSVWVLEAPAFPGRNILKGSVATEQLLVTGMAEALNSDPNTVDITAWSGNGLSIVADTTAPNGATALRCTGQGTTLLSRRFAVNDQDNYQVKTWAKAESGAPTAYLLVAFYDASGTLMSGTANPAGWTSVGDYHYFGLANQVMPAAWTNYDASFGKDETFKVPAGARYAALGMIANFSSGTVQRLSGMVCRRKVDGRVVVDGSLSARHIVTRGMSVVNDLGEVLLEAGGASTSPWVVQVDSTLEAGAIALSLPRDVGNRSVIRGLLVDGVSLKAAPSATGNSVVLSSSTTEVFNTVYDGDSDAYVVDGLVPLWDGYFDLEPNAAYTVTYELMTATVASATSGTLVVKLGVPAGSATTVHGNGTVFSSSAEDVAIASVSVSNATPANIGATTPLKVRVVTGATGGLMQTKVQALSTNLRVCAGTQITIQRHARRSTPQGSAIRVGTPVALGASSLRYTTGQTTFPAAQPYSGLLTLSVAVADPSYIFLHAGLSLINDVAVNGKVQLALKAFVLGQVPPPGANAQGCFLAVFDLLQDVPGDELSRWAFDCSLDVVSTSWPLATSTGVSTLVPPASTFDGDYPNVTYAMQLNRNQFGGGTLFSNTPGMQPYGTATMDARVQPRFMGAPIGDPVVFRFILTLA